MFNDAINEFMFHNGRIISFQRHAKHLKMKARYTFFQIGFESSKCRVKPVSKIVGAFSKLGDARLCSHHLMSIHTDLVYDIIWFSEVFIVIIECNLIVSISISTP